MLQAAAAPNEPRGDAMVPNGPGRQPDLPAPRGFETDSPPEAAARDIGRTLFTIVQEQPGVHFRGLARAARLTSAGQLRHHLDRLERDGLVVELSDGRYKRFFVTSNHDAEMRPGLARFSRLVPRRIGQLLLAGPMNRTALRRSLGCADSTLGYHLKRMLESGDLHRKRDGLGCHYGLSDHDFVRRLLRQQTRSNIDLPTTSSPTTSSHADRDETGSATA